MFNHRVAKPFLKDPFWSFKERRVQDRRDAEQEGCRTGEMKNRRDAEQEG